MRVRSKTSKSERPIIITDPKTGDEIRIDPKAKVQIAILRILMKSGELSTKDLEKLTKFSYSSVYNACQRLEELGVFTSDKREGGKVFWDPITGEAVTKKSYKKINAAQKNAERELQNSIERELKKYKKMNRREIQKDLTNILGLTKLPLKKKDWKSIKKVGQLVTSNLVDYSIPRWWVNEKLIVSLCLIITFLIDIKFLSSNPARQWVGRMFKELDGYKPITYYVLYWKLRKGLELNE